MFKNISPEQVPWNDGMFVYSFVKTNDLKKTGSTLYWLDSETEES